MNPKADHGFGIEMTLDTPSNRCVVHRGFVADAAALARLAAYEAEARTILRQVSGTAIAPPL